jgi:hypothetical protein
MKIKHEPSELGAVPVTEQPVIITDVKDMFPVPISGKMAEFIRQAFEEFAKDHPAIPIEFEAKCPDCNIDMEIMNILYEKPLWCREYQNKDHTKYNDHKLIGGDFFICPNCGFKRQRQVGRDIEILGEYYI